MPPHTHTHTHSNRNHVEGRRGFLGKIWEAIRSTLFRDHYRVKTLYYATMIGGLVILGAMVLLILATAIFGTLKVLGIL